MIDDMKKWMELVQSATADLLGELKPEVLFTAEDLTGISDWELANLSEEVIRLWHANGEVIKSLRLPKNLTPEALMEREGNVIKLQEKISFTETMRMAEETSSLLEQAPIMANKLIMAGKLQYGLLEMNKLINAEIGRRINQSNAQNNPKNI